MVSIERPETDDLVAIASLWTDLAAEQRDHRTHFLAEENRDVIVDVLAGHLELDGILVAIVGGDLVGFVTFGIEHGAFVLDATRGRVSNLYVRPEHRNDGLGAALLNAAEDALADRGADVVTIEAMADNDAAQRFYRRHGYRLHRVELERRLDEPGAERAGDEESV